MSLQKSSFNKSRFIFNAFFISMISVSAFAWNDINLNKTAHPPYHIKRNMSLVAPSGFSPAQIQTAYGLNLISQKGAGQIIGIVDAYDNPNAEADLGVFSSTFNLPACTTANGCFQKIYANGTQPAGDEGWAVEMSLDVQWAHAMAPAAKIMLVEAADSSLGSLLDAIQAAVQHGATVVSNSWGASEFSTESQYDTYFNVPNVSFTASSGDSGTGVIWPSVSSYVIATGGTSLKTDASGNYVSETAWSGSGGGLSAFIKMPSYQANFANKNNPNGMRGVPDVSLVSDPETGLSVYDTYGEGGWLVVGGTSAAAPAWAGILAVTNSASTNKLPNLNTALYTVAASAYAKDYHDITQGTNGSCGALCTAVTGYDYVTGLGSALSTGLVQSITGGDGGTCVRSAPTITISPNTPQTIQQNGSLTFNITIVDNDSASCPVSTFSLVSSVNSSLIKAALNTFSLATQPNGGKASAYMIVKASNVAVIGNTYIGTVKVADTVLNRGQTVNGEVTIGNSFR